MGEDSGEKTEQPTPHKLSEARRKGQVAKSKDFSSSIVLIVSYFSLKNFSGYIFSKIDSITYLAFNQIPLEFNTTIALFLLGETLKSFMYALMPLFMINFILVILLDSIQIGGIAFSVEPVIPNFGKLNPIEGIKKIFTLKQVVELIKSTIKMTIVSIIIYFVVVDQLPLVLLSQEITPFQVMEIVGNMVMKVVVQVGIFYVIIGVLDLFYQRFEFIKGMKMSKKEIKDEYKRLEGDPIIKQRQRDTQRQMAMGRQMGAVPEADVVVTNPIHIAMAIQYKPNHMQAPKVLAKGKRLVANLIIKKAEEHFIPVIENPPLARQLYQETEVGSSIPPMYYKAVAEILAFVYKLKKKAKERY